MDTNKVNEAVKLTCQLANMHKKRDKLVNHFTSAEYTEYQKRIKSND